MNAVLDRQGLAAAAAAAVVATICVMVLFWLWHTLAKILFTIVTLNRYRKAQ